MTGNRIGITTTVPLEPFFAAGASALDLNNLFITGNDPNSIVEEAQVRGYPRNICTWIKGLDTVSRDLDGVVGVIRGDCSNTESLLEAVSRDGIDVHSFSYPFNRSRKDLTGEIEALCDFLGTDLESASGEAGRIRELRDLSLEVDEIAWREGGISAKDVHLTLVSTSDFDGDVEKWKKRTLSLIDGSREPLEATEGPRLGYVGVPPIITDLFSRLQDLGSRVVFFEVQRQFAMPSKCRDWIDDYLEYTYPYGITRRVKDIEGEVKRRGLDGIVHYVQSFCHRQIDDMIFRKELDVPILTLEGNLPGPLDGRNLIRLESFLDVVEER